MTQPRPNLIGQTFVKAKNIVLNVSEMEAKVREATNEDPWYVIANASRLYPVNSPCCFARGASSTLMQEIAQG